jgi:hypothetical protein
MQALNGHEQEYHQANVFEEGLESPLLDLLGVRYFIMPSVPAADQTLPRLGRPLQTVFEDDDVRILDNESALPRAWIVHSAKQMEEDVAVASLATGRVDPRETALLEEPPPLLGASARDRADVITYDAERIELETTTTAPGLLVLSEIYDPFWKGYVDGAPAHVYVADGTLRALAIPAQEHRVELRYEPPGVRVGILVTTTTLVALLCFIVFVGRRRVCD